MVYEKDGEKYFVVDGYVPLWNPAADDRTPC